MKFIDNREEMTSPLPGDFCAPFGKGMYYSSQGDVLAVFVLHEQNNLLARLVSKNILNSRWELTFGEKRIEIRGNKKGTGYELKDMESGNLLGWFSYPILGCAYYPPNGMPYMVEYARKGRFIFSDSEGRNIATVQQNRGEILTGGRYELLDRREGDPDPILIWAICVMASGFSRA